MRTAFIFLKNIDDVVLVNGQLVAIKEDTDYFDKQCNSLLGHSTIIGFYKGKRILVTTYLTENVSIFLLNINNSN